MILPLIVDLHGFMHLICVHTHLLTLNASPALHGVFF